MISSNKETVVIVGAGITGNTAAIALAIKGYKVLVLEQGGIAPDEIRQGQGKSINLAASCRSLDYLKSLASKHHLYHLKKIENTIEDMQMVPMHARLIHTADGREIKQRYSQDDQVLQSINRNNLNKILYLQAKELGVTYVFNAKLKSIDTVNQSCTVLKGINEEIVPYGFLIGADGSNSVVGKSLDSLAKAKDPCERSPWRHQEYEIKPDHEGNFALSEAENFHIWPGQGIFLIALPNADKTFTVTLFCHKHKSNINLEDLKENNNLEGIKAIFSNFEPNSKDLDTYFNITHNFAVNNVSSIYSRNSQHWHEDSEFPRILLLGDAAHAFPPFLGLGFNACVEDVNILMCSIPDQSNKNLPDRKFPGEKISEVVVAFAKARKHDMHALRDASIDNALELSETVVDEDKLLKHALTEYLERKSDYLFCDPHTLYSFTHMPESEARFRQLWQDTLMQQLLLLPRLKETFKRNNKLEDCITPEILQVIDKQISTYQIALANWRNIYYPELMRSQYAGLTKPERASNSSLLQTHSMFTVTSNAKNNNNTNLTNSTEGHGIKIVST